MRVLATADWHLGKRTENKSRLAEQRAVLEEIETLVDEHGVDVLIVAGDVFDTAVPPSAAEDLFFEFMHRLGRKTLVAVLAGNHDDAQRLCASVPMANRCNVLLFDGQKANKLSRTDVAADAYGFSLAKEGERINVAMMPYPSEVVLALKEGESYADKTGERIAAYTQRFSEEGVNIFVSHLFMTGAENGLTDERELGTAKLLPKEILPDCDWVVLGHIHKPLTVSHRKKAYYPGSIMPYSFDDVTDKRVLLFDTQDRQMQEIPLTAYRKCVRIEAASAEEALERLDGTTDWVQIDYKSKIPLTSEEIGRIRRKENFTRILLPAFEVEEVERRTEATPKELFVAFYRSRRGVEPEDEIVDTFLQFFNGEDRQ